MNVISYRSINLYSFFLILALLTFAGYLQFELYIKPCPLCAIQRVIFALLGMLFFAGIFHIPKPSFRKLYGFCIMVVSLIGAAVAIRQVWLQNLPPGHAPSCGPGIDFLIANLPLTQAIKLLFTGTGECATVHWTFLNLSIAEWSLLFFIFFAVIAFIQAMRLKAI